jgi:hypothetical protein
MHHKALLLICKRIDLSFCYGFGAWKAPYSTDIVSYLFCKISRRANHN